MGLVITLILVGLLLVLAEVFLIPGFGVAGVLGLLSFGGSCFYAFHELGSLAGIIVLIIDLVSVLIIVFMMLRAKTWKRMTLSTNIDSKAVSSVENSLNLGEKGRTLTRLAPIGSVKFENDVYEVKALEGMIDPGVDVEIVLIEDNKIYVRQVTDII